MLVTHLVVYLTGPTLFVLATYCVAFLLKSAQGREDEEDNQLWDYLLNERPRDWTAKV